MTWSQLVVEPIKALLSRLASFAPKAVGGLVIAAVGWAIACALRQLLLRGLQAVGIDRLSEKAKLSEVLRRGAVRLTVAELLGQLGYWLVIVITLIAALQFMGVTVATEWLERIAAFIPRVIVSILILLVGMLVASFLGATARTASLNAGFPHGHLLGQAVSTMVVLLTVVTALEQLQVVTRTIEVAVYITLGAFGLAVALALGLGSQEFVKRLLSDLWESWKAPPR